MYTIFCCVPCATYASFCVTIHMHRAVSERKSCYALRRMPWCPFNNIVNRKDCYFLQLNFPYFVLILLYFKLYFNIMLNQSLSKKKQIKENALKLQFGKLESDIHSFSAYQFGSRYLDDAMDFMWRISVSSNTMGSIPV